jgi:hypothetical protein
MSHPTCIAPLQHSPTATTPEGSGDRGLKFIIGGYVKAYMIDVNTSHAPDLKRAPAAQVGPTGLIIIIMLIIITFITLLLLLFVTFLWLCH